MIKIKTIVEITGVIAREKLKPEFAKMPLRELRENLLNHTPRMGVSYTRCCWSPKQSLRKKRCSYRGIKK